MDPTERAARAYLETLGMGTPIYEPDGRVPPDFLLGGNIAVEVRRLNQNVTTPAGKTESLEESFLPLWRKMYQYLPTVTPSRQGESWYVGLRMSRPLEPWRKIQPSLRRALLAFAFSPQREPSKMQITPHLVIDLAPAGRSYDGFFILGSGIDRDAGGFVVAEVYRNLQHCILEKNRKIAGFRERYATWWLVLLDHIGHALDAEGATQLRALPMPSSSFSKVILVNPLAPSKAIEV